METKQPSAEDRIMLLLDKIYKVVMTSGPGQREIAQRYITLADIEIRKLAETIRTADLPRVLEAITALEGKWADTHGEPFMPWTEPVLTGDIPEERVWSMQETK